MPASITAHPIHHPVRVEFQGPRTLRILPDPVPDAVPPGKLLLGTRQTMISTGTELAFYEGYHAGLAVPGNPWAKYPFHPGYAAVSEVLTVGDGRQGFAPGDLVFHWGRHKSWSLADPTEEVVLPLPAGIDPRHALMARFVQIAATAAVRLGAFRAGPEADTVEPGPVPASLLVLGAGLIGVLAARVFQLAGCPDVTAQDVSPARLDLAHRMGLNTRPATDGTDPRRFDCVIDATGRTGLVPTALSLVADRGSVVMLGSPGGEQTLNLYSQVFSRSAALVGAHEGRVPVLGPLSRSSLNRAALAWIHAGTLDVSPLITATVPAPDIESAYLALLTDKDRNVATVIDWDKAV